MTRQRRYLDTSPSDLRRVGAGGVGNDRGNRSRCIAALVSLQTSNWTDASGDGHRAQGCREAQTRPEVSGFTRSLPLQLRIGGSETVAHGSYRAPLICDGRSKSAVTTLTGLLAGMKVMDLSVMISGTLGAMMLAEQGPNVFKIESPGFGDFMRYLGFQNGGVMGKLLNNKHGKQSPLVDMRRPDGVKVFRALASTADVVIQNFRPSAVDSLDTGYEALSGVNPDLNYVGISGYGPDGLASVHRVPDNLIQSYSGFASVQTEQQLLD